MPGAEAEQNARVASDSRNVVDFIALVGVIITTERLDVKLGHSFKIPGFVNVGGRAS